MGIDHLDIVFRIKKRFGIELEQEEWGCLLNTAGTLHEYLIARIAGHQPVAPDVFEIHGKLNSWLTRQPGRKWRRWKVTCCRPDNAVLPGQLPAAWADLSAHLGCRLPDLERDSHGELHWPASIVTPKALLSWLVLHEPRIVPPKREARVTATPPESPWTSDTSWQALREILAEALDIPLAQVVPEAHLVDDLGMG